MAAAQDPHPPLAHDPLAEQAIEAFLGGIAAVDPTVLVRTAVRQGRLDDWLFAGGARRDQPRWLQVLAIGKAAPRMLWGLVEAGVPFQGMGVAPPGVPAPSVDTFKWHQGDHPTPGARSFAAGRALLDWVERYPAGEPLLVLLSGGASACVEVPSDMSPPDLAAGWEELLRAGLPIEDMNAQRQAWSALKGGKLGKSLREKTSRIQVWVLADTDPATAPATVGSGPFYIPNVPHLVLASSDDLVAAAGLRLGAAGWNVYRLPRRIAGQAEQEAQRFVAAFQGLKGPNVALVGGGEPLVRVPPDAPPGGRSAHAALAASQSLRDGELFLAACSDGVDGSSKTTGAWSLASRTQPEVKAALKAGAAFSLLHAQGCTFDLGATGTNVGDLWVALARRES